MPNVRPLTRLLMLFEIPLCLMASCTPALAADLPRRADWQVSMRADPPAGAIQIATVAVDSPAARSGIAAGDRVLSIDGTPIFAATDVQRARHKSRAGREVVFEVDRAGVRSTFRWQPRARPRESYPGVEVIYESARTSAGFDVQMIVTRPSGRSNLPALVFIPWLSCGGVEAPADPTDGWGRAFVDLARTSGYAVVRVEKSGLGDSTGPACPDADLETDLAGFRAALRKVPSLPYVDPQQVFLLGGSIGASLVPVLARDIPVRGIIAAGGHYKTWLEHMLEIERRRLTLDGKSPAEVNAALRGLADFYALYLNGGLTPGQVTSRRADLAQLWTDAPDQQYGRPARYFHQLQALDVAGAWSEVRVPVLVIWGEYDWIMSREDQSLIVETVERRVPGGARLVVVPRMGHDPELFPTPAKAYADEDGAYATTVVPELLRWIEGVRQGAKHR